MTTPRIHVSVVVPTHRRPKLLRALLESLAEQSYPHELLEIVVVGSANDGAAGVVDEFRDRGLEVRCLTMPDDPWRGRSAAAKRNYGVQVASGTWIAFIDDDCRADADWIAGAAAFFADPQAVAIEGEKVIPGVHPPTLTYKGLLSFKRPGGFQTCNMFYRRDVFLQLGGFDTRFPFYLEDSDLAWTVLETGRSIPFATAARVIHPVSAPAPWRLLDDARRTMLLPLLRRKHPAEYRRAGIRAVRRSHVMYLTLYAILLAAFALGAAKIAAVALLALGFVVVAHAARLFWGCRVGLSELFVTTLLLPAVPVVRLVQFLRGSFRYQLLRRETA